MSELKVYGFSGNYYLKSEADKVIAELEEKLKVQTSIAEEGWKEAGIYHTSYAEAVKELYDKNKEIAELEESHKKEVRQLLILNREQANAANRFRDSMEQTIRHQKYKRCFKLARWCVQMMVFNSRYGTDKKWHLFKKWHKRWLELAEKFKEAK